MVWEKRHHPGAPTQECGGQQKCSTLENPKEMRREKLTFRPTALVDILIGFHLLFNNSNLLLLIDFITYFNGVEEYTERVH